jgi:hypothetical protein
MPVQQCGRACHVHASIGSGGAGHSSGEADPAHVCRFVTRVINGSGVELTGGCPRGGTELDRARRPQQQGGARR